MTGLYFCKMISWDHDAFCSVVNTADGMGTPTAQVRVQPSPERITSAVPVSHTASKVKAFQSSFSVS